ncbi:MAG: hypothetical protein ACI8WP_001295 [Flavobacteriaceae bacterium]
MVFSAYYLHQISSSAPSESLGNARKNLTKALKYEANLYAENEYKRATELYDSALTEWQFQNTVFPIVRDYKSAQAYALSASYWAEESYIKSIARAQNLSDLINSKLKSVERKLDNYRQNYGNLPISKKASKTYSSSEMLFAEAKLTSPSTDLHTSMVKLLAAEDLIDSLEESSNLLLKNYFESYHLWKKIFNNGVSTSLKNKSLLIVVDKFQHECQIYQNGQIKTKFNIELGPNWIGDKMYAGDKSTPEGAYKVLSKKKNANTIYHKALLIDYPNPLDKVRFEQNKIDGKIPKAKSIGGLIELHGHGTKGADWTDGCVAIANEDMDKLFDWTSVGTPVIIVGSLKPLAEIIK